MNRKARLASFISRAPGFHNGRGAVTGLVAVAIFE
jgi:hypothetical protein